MPDICVCGKIQIKCCLPQHIPVDAVETLPIRCLKQQPAMLLGKDELGACARAVFLSGTPQDLRALALTNRTAQQACARYMRAYRTLRRALQTRHRVHAFSLEDRAATETRTGLPVKDLRAVSHSRVYAELHSWAMHHQFSDERLAFALMCATGFSCGADEPLLVVRAFRVWRIIFCGYWDKAHAVLLAQDVCRWACELWHAGQPLMREDGCRIVTEGFRQVLAHSLTASLAEAHTTTKMDDPGHASPHTSIRFVLRCMSAMRQAGLCKRQLAVVLAVLSVPM